MKKTIKIALHLCLISLVSALMFTACDITRFLPSFEETTSSESVPEITTPEETTPVPHAHVEVIDPAVAPTCARTGRTEGKHCSVCGEVLVAQKVISVLGHTETLDPAVAPTCADEGKTEGKHCSVCNKILVAQQTIPALGHKYVSTVTPPATSGDVVAKYTCSVCGDSYTQTIQLVDFTVTEDNRGVIGYTGKTGENLVIPAVFQNNGVWYRVTAIGDRAFDYCENLTSVTIPNTVKGIGKWAFHWCTNLTRITLPNSIKSMALSSLRSCDSLSTITFEGTKNEWNTIDKDDSWDLFSRGYVIYCTDGNICKKCVEVITPAVAATCAATGLTEGKHCSVCGKVIVAQNIIPARGHIETNIAAISATCTATGLTEGKYCSVCNGIIIAQEIIPALGHTEVIDKAVAPTCTTTGLTEGKHCGICSKLFIAQIDLPSLGHTEVVDNAVTPTYTDTGLTEGVHCSACNTILVAQEMIPALGYYANPELYDDDYGYQYLGTMTKGTVLQDLYEMLDEVSLAFHTDSTINAVDNIVGRFDFASLGLTDNEAVSVWISYKWDHPLYYWISSLVTIEGTDLLLLTEDAYAKGTDRAAYNELVYGAIAEYASEVAGETSSYRIALAFHDAIIYAIDYAYEDDGITPRDDIWAHNILGVFEKQSGVCEAYARTFQLLLNCMGVDNIFVTGKGNGGNHGWNLVQMDDGNWYWFDLTWDDTPDWMWGISYNYFCVNDSQNAAWSDYGWVNPEASFLDTHTLALPTGQGVDFLYALPSRSASVYDTDALLLRDSFEVDGLVYAVIGYDTVALTRIYASGEIVIPEEMYHNGVSYKVIAVNAMWDGHIDSGIVCEIATSITIPKSVVFIGDEAFLSHTLENIYVVNDNPYFASQDGVLFTKSLNTLIQYPLANKRTAYVIPNNVVTIAHKAFGEGTDSNPVSTKCLEELTIGAKVSAVGIVNWGFGYDESFNNLIGEFVRIYNSLCGEKKLLIDENDPQYTVVNGILYSKDMSEVIFAPSPTEDEDTIPDLPEGNSWIDENGYIFYEDDNSYYLLGYTGKEDRLILPLNCNGNEYAIYEGAFAGRSDLRSVVISDGVICIGVSAFSGCYNLTSITIGQNVIKIEDHAFASCCSLTSLTIPNSVTRIGNNAFAGCFALTSIRIPYSVTSIGYSAFQCVYLTSITVDPDNTIYHSNRNCLIETASKTLIAGCISSVIPDDGSVTSIGDYAFYGCDRLTDIIIPGNITRIGYFAFAGCGNMTNIVLSDNIRRIDDYVFGWCYKLTNIMIPYSVTSISGYAFYACGSLTNITFNGTVAQWNDITFHNNWKNNVPATEVICSDGVVSLN